ncbi:hypothetical protein VHEMI07962 [[Torrubiella] hemipterigena]|uniref:DUF7102 domain-containing protein n=1 Tax=[Torrubiella] hemipterigena TaxID=1531966 RepID=A0A0A1TNV3_9HYPO|nr:hypothetical protein VHEMI07962 [[Torrubiella] hemipterigena]
MFGNSLSLIYHPILIPSKDDASQLAPEPPPIIDLTSMVSTPASESTDSTVQNMQDALHLDVEPGRAPEKDSSDNGQHINSVYTRESRATSPEPLPDDIMARIGAIMQRKELHQTPTTQSTASMIDDYLQMRAIETVRPSLPHRVPAQPSIPQPVKRTPAAYPPYQVPAEKGTVFVSIKLKPSILQLLDQVWESQSLIDVDYSRACPASEGYVEEADITISHETGIIVTNIHHVRQKPQPNSGEKTPLRRRVDAVSTMYEHLLVLVSEENPMGEYVTEASPSDTRAYLEFVKYTEKLNGVTCSLVAGSDGTLAHWILSLMCKHSDESIRLNGQLSGLDTALEIHFRRTGMNIATAKFLAQLVLDDGGLDALLSMSAAEQARQYASLGPKSLFKMRKMVKR